jgi:hypothetical protein
MEDSSSTKVTRQVLPADSGTAAALGVLAFINHSIAVSEIVGVAKHIDTLLASSNVSKENVLLLQIHYPYSDSLATLLDAAVMEWLGPQPHPAVSLIPVAETSQRILIHVVGRVENSTA